MIRSAIRLLTAPFRAIGWGILFAILYLLGGCGGGDDGPTDKTTMPVACITRPGSCA